MKQEAIATAHITRNIRRSLKKASHGYPLNSSIMFTLRYQVHCTIVVNS